MQDLCEKARLGLLSLQVLRTVGFLRDDIAGALHASRPLGTSVTDGAGTPSTAAAGNRAGCRRLSRCRVRTIVDADLGKLDQKTRAYQATRYDTPVRRLRTSTRAIWGRSNIYSVAPTPAPPRATRASRTEPATTRPRRPDPLLSGALISAGT